MLYNNPPMDRLTQLVKALSHKRSGGWFFVMPVVKVNGAVSVPTVLNQGCSINAFCPDQGYFRSDLPFGESAWLNYGLLFIREPVTMKLWAVPITEVVRVNPSFDWQWALHRSQRRPDLSMQVEYEMGIAQRKQQAEQQERVIKDVQAEVIDKKPTFH